MASTEPPCAAAAKRPAARVKIRQKKNDETMHVSATEPVTEPLISNNQRRLERLRKRQTVRTPVKEPLIRTTAK
jgi:hypothetical protein